MTIGQIAQETGCKVPTIRYYEKIGLLPEPMRTEGNQRRYGSAHAARLGFIRHGRELGFPLEAIRDLLEMADDPERFCTRASRIAGRHLSEVERRIESLTALKGELQRMINQCAGGLIKDCRVIEVLADHSQCGSDSH